MVEMKTTIQSVKGTREFYPEDMAVRTWLYNIIREVSESFGYEEYEAPLLEKLDLYAAKSGDELVKKQSFVFQDRGGEYVTLRPELTPSLARMVAQKQKSLIYPLRWWSYGPFWRYERPQKGRAREFFQWNIDILGSDAPEADAEIIAACASFFKKVGFSPQQVQISVNNRRLMGSVLDGLKISSEKRMDVFHLVDRQEKMSAKEWQEYAFSIGLSSAQFEGLQAALNDPALWEQSEELGKVFDAIKAMGMQDYIRFDPKIIRGLDYYTGTVFEAIHLEEGGRSILGGGRYDNLVADVGGEPLGGVGFALGDVLMLILLENAGLLPKINPVPASVMVTVFDETSMVVSQTAAAELRQAGIHTICYPEAIRLNKQLRYADRLGMRYVVILGPDEVKKGQVTLKDLSNGSQKTFDRKDWVDRLSKMLAVE
jgi:histidyl-tRNA synthetase